MVLTGMEFIFFVDIHTIPTFGFFNENSDGRTTHVSVVAELHLLRAINFPPSHVALTAGARETQPGQFPH